jgi:HAD superfamily hydrolase (TIGR01450 family)
VSQTPGSQPPAPSQGDAYDWFVRGRALYEDGSAAAAVELLGRALAAEPQARSIREVLARALFDAGRYLDATDEFEALVVQAPDDHYAHFGAGLANWRLSHFTAAAEHLAIAVAMRPQRKEYLRARDQVRATIQARVDAGLPIEGVLSMTDTTALERRDPSPPDLLPREPALPDVPAPGLSPLASTPLDHVQLDPRPDPTSPDLSTPGAGLTAAALCRSHDVALLDLDGVVYRGPHAVPHAVQCIAAAAAQGLRVAYVTNNASRTAVEVAQHLRDLGLAAHADDVVTSAQAAAALIRDRVPAAARVLAVGGPGVPAALEAVGLTVVRPHELAAAASQAVTGAANGASTVAAVLMGYGPGVGWADLAEAAYAVAGGALFVASNTDLTVPTDRGVAPGNGTLVAAVATATGRDPIVAGKPFAPLLEQSMARTDARSPLVVGDRLDTDIEAATRLGLPSLLVLTGVTDVPELLAAPAQHRPTYVAADLRGLLARGRLVSESPAAQLAEGGALQLAELDDSTAAADPLLRLRAAAAACWAAADQGRAVTWSESAVAALAADVERALSGGSGH